jgi:hypothetical protein
VNSIKASGALSDRWRGLGIFAVAQLTQLPDQHVYVLPDPICGMPGGSSTPKIDLRTRFRVPRTESPYQDLSPRRLASILLGLLEKAAPHTRERDSRGNQEAPRGQRQSRCVDGAACPVAEALAIFWGIVRNSAKLLRVVIAKKMGTPTELDTVIHCTSFKEGPLHEKENPDRE